MVNNKNALANWSAPSQYMIRPESDAEIQQLYDIQLSAEHRVAV